MQLNKNEEQSGVPFRSAAPGKWPIFLCLIFFVICCGMIVWNQTDLRKTEREEQAVQRVLENFQTFKQQLPHTNMNHGLLLKSYESLQAQKREYRRRRNGWIVAAMIGLFGAIGTSVLHRLHELDPWQEKDVEGKNNKIYSRKKDD